MVIVNDYVEVIEFDGTSLLRDIEKAGRTCYKSETNITNSSASKFVRGVIKRGHEAVIEHGSISVRFVCDRGVSHELVRHRLTAVCQESTRYVNYKNSGLQLIHPAELTPRQQKRRESFFIACQELYMAELDEGQPPQIARGVLPTALKTELVITANPREWRHIIKMRCDKAAHPQMRILMRQVWMKLEVMCPELFEDIVLFSDTDKGE